MVLALKAYNYNPVQTLGANIISTDTTITSSPTTAYSPAQQLNAAITDIAATSITVNGPAGSPIIANGDTILIDNEQMKVTAGAGTTTLTVVRGQNGTAAATHPINAAITRVSIQNGHTIKIDNELMLVTAGAGTNTLTVTRAQNGTAAAPHSAGSLINHYQLRYDLNADFTINVVDRTIIALYIKVTGGLPCTP
jgi:hypothetical protein